MRSRIAQPARLARPVAPVARNFARAATGLLGSLDGMATYAAGTPRTLNIFTVSNCNAQEPVDEDPRGAYGLTPRGINSHGLFATSNYTSKALVYRSSTGLAPFTQVHDFGYASGLNCEEMMVTSTGRLIAWVQDGAGEYAVWYTTGNNDGTLWARAKDGEGADLSFRGYPLPWGWSESSGTIVASGWMSPAVAEGREIWRSTDDGATWTRVYTTDVDDISNFNAVCHHAGTSRWVIDSSIGE